MPYIEIKRNGKNWDRLHLEIGPNKYGGISTHCVQLYNNPQLHAWVRQKFGQIAMSVDIEKRPDNRLRFTLKHSGGAVCTVRSESPAPAERGASMFPSMKLQFPEAGGTIATSG